MNPKPIGVGGGAWPVVAAAPSSSSAATERKAKTKVHQSLVPESKARSDRTKAPVRAPEATSAPGGQGIAGTLAARNRQANLERRWNLVTRALGQGAVPRVRAGEKWSYFFDRAGPGEITYPSGQLLKLEESEALGCLGHEIGHWLYSRYPAAKELKQKAFHTLWNAVEDVRINRMVGTCLPGLVDLIRRADAKSLDPQVRARLIQQGKPPTRALQMAFAILYEGHTDGERDPLATHPDVRAAMDQARPLIAEASRLPPNVDLRYEKMDEEQIIAEAERSFAIIRDRLWPIFSELIAKDLQDPLHPEEPRDKDDAGAVPPEEGEHSQAPEIEQEQGGDGGSSTGLEQSRSGQGSGDESPPPDAEAKGQGGKERAERGGEGQGAEAPKPDGAEEGTQEGEGAAKGDGDRRDAKSGAVDGGEASADPGEGQGAGRADAAADPVEGAQGEGDPWRLPEHDPLETKDGAGEAGREALEEQLEAVHKQLQRKTGGPGQDSVGDEGPGDKSEEAGASEGAPEKRPGSKERPDPFGSGGPGRPTGMHALPKKTLDELLGEQALRPVKEDATALGVARWQEIRDQHVAEIEALVRALPTILEARYSRPWTKEYGREGRYDLARELTLGWKQEATGVRDPHRRRLRGLPQRTDKPTILVFDVSGSMKGPKGMASQELMVIFTEAFERANAPNAAFCYSEDTRLLTPPNGVRSPELYGACLNEMICGDGNNELAALDTTEELLAQFGAQDGLVVFVTDTYAAKPAPGQESCRDRVLRLERTTGAKVVAIDLSRLDATQYELEPGELPPFPNSRILEHIEDLPHTFAEVVRDFVDASS